MEAASRHLCAEDAKFAPYSLFSLSPADTEVGGRCEDAGPLFGLFRSCERRRPKNQLLPPECPQPTVKRLAPWPALQATTARDRKRAGTVLVPCTTTARVGDTSTTRPQKQGAQKRRLAPGGGGAPPPPWWRSTPRLRMTRINR